MKEVTWVEAWLLQQRCKRLEEQRDMLTLHSLKQRRNFLKLLYLNMALALLVIGAFVLR